MADANSLWRDRNKVFVAGIPAHVDDDALYHKFRAFGEMFQSKVVLDARTGKSKGFGFLTFADYEHALEAVAQMNQAKWENRVLNVRFLQPKGEASGDAPAARQRPAKIFGPCPPGCTTVYVGNLAYGITEPVLRKVFASCGDIKAVRFAEHIETKEFRGFGYVQFYDGAACEKALRLDGTIVMGRPMNLDYGSRDEATEKAREELQRKLKKGICHKFQSGACPRGDDCKFAHVLSAQDAESVLHATPSAVSAEAPAAAVAPVVPEDGDDTPVCQSFLNGKCKRGDKCKFRHVEEGAVAPVPVAGFRETPVEAAIEAAEDETPVCQSFLKGKCKRGDKCKFRHVGAEATTTPVSSRSDAAPPVSTGYYEDRGGRQRPQAAQAAQEEEVPACQSFLKGTCKRGEKCKFRHVDAADDASVPAPHVPTAPATDAVPVCLNYQKGTCQRGSACRFRHVDAVETETTTPVASALAPEATEAADDAPICQNFVKGKCKRGAKCRFRHVDAPAETVVPAVVPTVSICQNFQRGRCTRGSSCRFAHATDGVAAAAAVEAAAATAHSEYQKRFQSVCYNWQNARSCARGDACPFFHDGARRDDEAPTHKRKADDDSDDDKKTRKKKTKND